MIKVFVIAPYKGLVQLISSIADQYSDYYIRADEGNLEQGLALAQKAEAEGYDVILSRGGTTKLITDKVSLPVLNIPVSGYDIMRSITLVQSFVGKKAVVGFDSITNKYRAVNALLNSDMEIVTIKQESDVLPTLKKLQQEGVSTIIGDVVTVNYAKGIGLNGMLIISGEESIREALDQLKTHMKYLNHHKKQSQIYQKILLGLPGTILYAYNATQDMLCANQSLEYDFNNLQGYLEKQVDGIFQTGHYSNILTGISGSCYKVTGFILKLDANESIAVFTINEIQNSLSKNAGIKIVDLPDLKELTYNLFNSNNLKCKEMMDRVMALTNTHAPILLEGEHGTCKELLAQLIQRDGKELLHNLLIIDCSVLTKEIIQSLFEDFSSPDQTDGKVPVILKRIDCLSKSNQQEFYTYHNLYNRNGNRFRFVATSEQNMQDMVHVGSFAKELYTALGFSCIWLPPLRQHKEDIESLASIIISQENERSGKQVVGIEKDALKLFYDYNWGGNIRQLKNILHEAINTVEGPFVTSKKVLALLSVTPQGRRSTIDITPGKTLEEMEKEIIVSILQEVNLNQSLAAECLGISRTTLWRKLRTANNNDNIPIK